VVGMQSFEIKGNIIELRADGCLKNMSDWTPELAEKMASLEGLMLTEAHWNVLNTMRAYYSEYNTSPVLKLLRRELSKQYGKELASLETLEALFPYGVAKQGSRFAGLPVAQLDAELDQSQRLRSVENVASFKEAAVSHYNDQFEFKGKTIKVYASGNLTNPEDWNEELAEVLAQKEGIVLTDEHWKVINYLRKFYFQYGIAPMVKVLFKHMTEELGKYETHEDYVHKLFPGGPAKQGSRIAGLPRPQGCIDG